MDGAMWKIELLDGVADVPRDEWNALVGDESPFLEWDWLASLEEAGVVGAETGWLPKPLVVRDGPRLLAACPLYVKGHSEGEFVFDWGWADAAERAGIRYYPKLLVSVPFTPVAGARLLVAPGEDRPAWIQRLGAALRDVCNGNDLSGVHLNFTRGDETEPLRREGYLLRVGFQYHWRNDGFGSFDDYLARFRSKRRNQIKRERRAMQEQGVVIEARVGDAIDDDLFEPMFDFYRTNVENHYWGRQYLNRRFFELLRERFKHRLCFVVARLNGPGGRDGEPIAGTATPRAAPRRSRGALPRSGARGGARRDRAPPGSERAQEERGVGNLTGPLEFGSRRDEIRLCSRDERGKNGVGRVRT
jgi:predicted N-acyltransferase